METEMTEPRQPVRVAMIGAGRMANSVHYPSLAALPDAVIIGICDLDAERVNATGDKYGIAARFDDYQKMIADTNPDAVYAIGPPEIMYNIWVWCLTHAVDLFVEKPLGLTLHQAQMLAHLAEQNGRITQVGFQRRNSPIMRELMARARQHGDVVHAVCRFYKNDISPMLGARDRMMDDGVHGIDTLRAVCGGEVVKITSTTKRIGVPDINFILASIDFSNGSSGVLINSWSSGRRIFAVELHAPHIAIEADLEGHARIYEDGDTKGEVLSATDIAGSEDYFVYGGFKDKSREFIESVRTRTLPSSHFGDALKTMEVAETVLAQALMAHSSEQGRAVS